MTSLMALGRRWSGEALVRPRTEEEAVQSLIQTAAVTAETTGLIAHGLAAARAEIADALAMFAKVVELVAKVVQAAASPLLAVRALWKALTALYELLVSYFSEPAEPAPGSS